MKIVIIGGGGLLGRKLSERLTRDGSLHGSAIERLDLVDLAEPPPLDAGFPVNRQAGDIGDAATLTRLIPADTDVIFHLAAVLSGHAEAEFDDGMRTNLFGTLNVLERCRALDAPPMVIFASSVATFGGEIPQPIEDWYLLNPQTSYGTQKAIGELLLNDYSRKGFIDGRGLRLPTVTVRPGKPNRAASSFASSIFREPLQGDEAICPVSPGTRMWICSPRMAVDNLIHGAGLEAKAWGQNRCLALPGLLCSIAEMVEAMGVVAGDAPAARIRWKPDPDIARIVAGWPANIKPEKAMRLGFKADSSFEDNIRYFLENDIATES